VFLGLGVGVLLCVVLVLSCLILFRLFLFFRLGEIVPGEAHR
jgi:hypothetical protein